MGTSGQSLFRISKYWPVWALGLSLVAVGSAILGSVGIPPRSLLAGTNNLILFAGAWLPMTGILAGWAIIKSRPKSPLSFLVRNYFTRSYWVRALAFVPIVVCLSVFMTNFSAMKSAIPAFSPFSWDPAFIAMDRAMLFGWDAWQVIHPLVGYPIATAALAGLYHLWILLIYVGSLYMGINQPDDRLRLQYFIAYFLCWSVIGVALATLFSSVGPCFMMPLFGDATFVPLMDYLVAADRQVPVMVLDVQALLLQWHATGQYGLGRGITAMPSMHVALAVLFWLGIRRISRLGGWIFGTYAWLIFIGSIHTGYHYAVDGILAAVVAIALWALSGVFTRWWTRDWHCRKTTERAEAAS